METYTVEQVAEVLHVTKYTVRELLKAKHLKGRKIGKRWLIMASDLQAYLGSA